MSLSTTATDSRAWDQFVHKQGGSLLQTSAWGELKSAFGWRVQTASVVAPSGVESGALMLFRELPMSMGSVAYVPRGPVADWQDTERASRIIGAMDAVARQRRAVFLKIEPDAADTPALRQLLAEFGYRPSPQTIQPPRTILLDIRGSDEEIQARMNQGTRRKLRTAEKREIVIRRGDVSDLESYSHMAAITGDRDGFGVHSPAYYRRALEMFAPDHAALLMASYGGHDLAGLMVFALGKRAWYLYGASSNEERERMPNYALQWEAIRWARERGCESYDLWGVPDADEATLESEFQTRHDGLWGVYGFKRGFGGRVWRSVGSWDKVYNPLLYWPYRLLMRARD